jgi:hypothetical protein
MSAYSTRTNETEYVLSGLCCCADFFVSTHATVAKGKILKPDTLFTVVVEGTVVQAMGEAEEDATGCDSRDIQVVMGVVRFHTVEILL